jgi:nucleoid-associated protein YgaU
LNEPPAENIRGYVDPEPYLEGAIMIPAEPAPVERWHIVRLGETLWAIAQKYYGNGLLWKRIFEVNKERIKNPNLIYPLQKLLIP